MTPKRARLTSLNAIAAIRWMNIGLEQWSKMIKWPSHYLNQCWRIINWTLSSIHRIQIQTECRLKCRPFRSRSQCVKYIHTCVYILLYHGSLYGVPVCFYWSATRQCCSQWLDMTGVVTWFGVWKNLRISIDSKVEPIRSVVVEMCFVVTIMLMMMIIRTTIIIIMMIIIMIR